LLDKYYPMLHTMAVPLSSGCACVCVCVRACVHAWKGQRVAITGGIA
jgi:hypothetical protein